MGEPRVESDGAVRVLVVNEEPTITRAIAAALRDRGFETLALASGGGAERAIDTFRPDLVVLDVTLPDLDPVGLARRLHDSRRGSLVICLTARHAGDDEPADAAIGDERFASPFDVADVIASVCAVFRLTFPEARTPSTLCFADVVLDERTHEVTRASAPVELSPTEFNLLRFFLLNPRRVLSKRQILDNVWRNDFGGDASVVETYVSYLRKKLDTLGPPLIQTVRLVGYVLRGPQP